MAERNKEAENKLATDVFAWFLNVSTSVLIVFVNKVLMDPKMGYKFVFGELIFVRVSTVQMAVPS